PPFGQLVGDHPMKDILTRLEPEDGVGKLDRAGRLGRQCLNVQLHHASPSLWVSATASAGVSAAASAGSSARFVPRKLPGTGTPSGSLRFTESRSTTQPPLEPGTAPRI